MKPKKCANKKCGKEFTPYTAKNSIIKQKYCSACLIEKGKEKIWKQQKIVLKNKLKRVSDYRADARALFQKWIRIRDLGKTCISCPTVLRDIRDYDAGHYYNAKNYPALLFNEHNVNGQCVYCNQHLSANLIEYRKGLIKRYGEQIVEELDRIAEDKSVRTLSKEYYIEIAEKYKSLLK